MPATQQKKISTNEAPSAIGPYSQAIVAGGFVHCSGQIALDPKTGELVGEDVGGQTERVFRNLEAILRGAGLGLGDVVKTTVYLVDMADFKAMNEVYERQFASAHPARTTIAAAGLPKNARVEIDAVAIGRD